MDLVAPRRHQLPRTVAYYACCLLVISIRMFLFHQGDIQLQTPFNLTLYRYKHSLDETSLEVSRLLRTHFTGFF